MDALPLNFIILFVGLIGFSRLPLVQLAETNAAAQQLVATLSHPVVNGGVTKINYRITPLVTGTDNNMLRVTLTTNRFMPNTFIAIGFNDKQQMPGAFIATCEKLGNGTIVVRERYAFEHAPPPVTPWGVVAHPSSSPNSCEFDIPQKLKAPETVGLRGVIDLAPTTNANGQRYYVLNSRGNAKDNGDIQYHGPTKEISKLQFRKP